MRHRWYYVKWLVRTKRLLILGLAGFIVPVGILMVHRDQVWTLVLTGYHRYGVTIAEHILEGWEPEAAAGAMPESIWFPETGELFSYLESRPRPADPGKDPAYKRMQDRTLQQKIWKENNNASDAIVLSDQQKGNKTEEEQEGKDVSAETITIHPSSASVIKEKLSDYDYVMKQFYSVHPTTTAGKEMIDARHFLQMDLSVEKKSGQPQILIYHTHSQEAYADYPRNEKATVVGVGAYLAQLLEQKGYGVIHDTAVYDKKGEVLDRSKAYTYALEGITGILQTYPTIEVVLDVHRDGVSEDQYLISEINGKPTARIMFFHGTSQSPDGPNEYLPNPNRDANMAFSFQMQMKAAEQYPGFTRKIYLKGLRYNQHVRARTTLIEVGAQTNTYAEALNAMEPLAEILAQVLDGV